MSFKSPLATTTNWGVVRVGDGITVVDGIISTGGTPTASLNYGFFADTTTQTNPVPDTANLITINTTETNDQVTVLGSQITVTNTGTYAQVFTLSFEKVSPGTPTTASIWLRKNGVDVPNSSQSIDVPNQLSLLFVTGNYTLDLLAGDNIELVWSSPDIDVQLSFLPAAVAPVRPSTPSVKVSLIRIS